MRKAAGLLLTFALVFAAAFGGMSAETQAASRIRLNRNTLTMTKGERFRLRVRNLPEGARYVLRETDEDLYLPGAHQQKICPHQFAGRIFFHAGNR